MFWLYVKIKVNYNELNILESFIFEDLFVDIIIVLLQILILALFEAPASQRQSNICCDN